MSKDMARGPQMVVAVLRMVGLVFIGLGLAMLLGWLGHAPMVGLFFIPFGLLNLVFYPRVLARMHRAGQEPPK